VFVFGYVDRAYWLVFVFGYVDRAYWLVFVFGYVDRAYWLVFVFGYVSTLSLWNMMCICLIFIEFNPLRPELNPSAQRCLTRFFTVDFASWTVHFVSICVKNQQIHQLLIQFINYVR
jgi:hypothetical protein